MMTEDHPFDRYAPYTDVTALKRASDTPLRKCVRVNTLLTNVEQFREWAQGHDWHLTQVPWCEEGFFVDREDRTRALGKDLRHLLGHVYVQEASSMLPVMLLDPQPGDRVLDLTAAPGSKTTQMAARMGNRGVIVANDVQDKRLQILKSALERLGVTNAIVTKKDGRWFGAHMTGRFDRVLCDAPCSAQGTVRKDRDALKYSSENAVKKCVSMQTALLESAVHCAKIGGRIVYSTCTLTPEENEEIVANILNKYCDQLSIVDPRKTAANLRSFNMRPALKDSKKVQSRRRTPALRIWPQTYDTEGFFCAVFEKTGPTLEGESVHRVYFNEQPIPKTREADTRSQVAAHFGTDFMDEGDRLVEREGQLVLTRDEVYNFSLPLRNYCLGLPYAKVIKRESVRLTDELITVRGARATRHVIDVSDDDFTALLGGADIACDASFEGDIVIRWRSIAIGMGLAQSGTLRNRLSRWLIQQTS